MSSTEETNELKAGHPPAVKVGGMRITQHKPPAQEKAPQDATVKKEGEADEGEVEEETGSPPKQPSLVISGAVARGDADFPAEAVQAFHTKPIPAHDFRPVSKPNLIHQPRK